MSKYIPRNVLISVVPICVVITLLSVYWFRKKKKFKFDSPSSDSIVLKSDLTTEVCSDSADTLSDASSLASPMSSEKSLRTKNLNSQNCLDGSLGCGVKESPVSMMTAKAALYSSVSHPDDIVAATSIAKDIISQVEKAAETVLESKSPFQPNQNENGYGNDFLGEVDSTPFQFDMEKIMKAVETNSNDSRSSVLDENSLSYVSDDSEGRQPSKNKDSLSSVLDENSYSYVSDDSEAMTEMKARDSALSATESEQEHAIPESPNTDSDSAETQNGEKSESPDDSVVPEAPKTEDGVSGIDNADSQQQPEETNPIIETTSTSPDKAESQKPEVRLTNGPSSPDLDKVNHNKPVKSTSPPKESVPNGPTSEEKVLHNGHHPALNKGSFSDVLSNKKASSKAKDGAPKVNRSLTNDFEAKLTVSSEPQRQQSPKRELSYSQVLKGSLPKPATCDNGSSPSSNSAKSSSDESASSPSSPPECSEKPSQEVEVPPAPVEMVQPLQHGYDEMGWTDDHPNPHEVLDDPKDLKESGEFRYEFELPQELCGRLIGKQGKHVRSIKDRSNANVYIKRHPFDPQLKIVVVEGEPSDVKEALELIRRKYPLSQFPSVTLVKTNEISSILPDSLQLHLPEGTSCDVILSSLVNAGHFFLQQPTHPTYPSLSTLDQYMSTCYSQSNTPLMPHPVVAGVICAAPIAGGWFRAQVIHVYEGGTECELKFVDYGGFVTTSTSALRQIRSDFMTLPFQASQCYLANVRPVDPMSEAWTAEATALFEELAQGQILQAMVMEYAPDGVPCVNLYKVQGISSMFINKELVERGHAVWVNSSHWDPH